jgi:hypothetical protein
LNDAVGTYDAYVKSFSLAFSSSLRFPVFVSQKLTRLCNGDEEGRLTFQLNTNSVGNALDSTCPKGLVEVWIDPYIGGAHLPLSKGNDGFHCRGSTLFERPAVHILVEVYGVFACHYVLKCRPFLSLYDVVSRVTPSAIIEYLGALLDTPSKYKHEHAIAKAECTHNHTCLDELDDYQNGDTGLIRFKRLTQNYTVPLRRIPNRS